MKMVKVLSLLFAVILLISACGCNDTVKINNKWEPTDGKTAENLDLWLTNSLDRVRKNRVSNGQKTIEISGAMGEYESFQIVASTDSSEKITLTGLTVSDFTTADGDVIESDKYVTVYREHYINCTVQSPTSADVIQETVGEIPDALIPVKDPVTGEALGSDARFYAFPFELDNTACQPFFIDVEIPRDAKAGEYTAVYEMQTNNGSQGGVVTLKVWNIALSEVQTQGSFFGAWSSLSDAKREEAAKNRMFIATKDAKQQEEFYNKYGYNNANLGFWSNADIDNSESMKDAPLTSEVEEKKAKQYDKLNLFAYTADEIGGASNLYEKIIEYGKALHRAGVKQLITMPPVAELMDDGLGNNQAAVDIWVMLPKQFDSNQEIIAEARTKKDAEIWTYNCLVQDNYSPKYLLDYPLIDFRIHPGFINYAIDADGFLFWVIDNWNTVGDPWTSLDMRFNGDGILFYPSEDVGVDSAYIPSLRAKAIRDGFEDFELCAAIEKMGGSVTEYTSKIATSFSDWTQDANTLIENRKVLGDANSK